MIWGIVVALGVMALILGGIGVLVAGLIEGIVNLVFAPDREATTQTQAFGLAGTGVVAFIATVILASTAPGAVYVPIFIWIVGFAILRNSAPLKETPAQRLARETAARKQAEEDEKRAAVRKAIAQRKRLDSFTKDGLALVEHVEAAVRSVNATEAARQGWLGQPSDIDFSADLMMISEALLQARRIEKVVERTKKIPDPSPDDTSMLRDAQKTVKALRGEAKARVKIIDDCLKQAREIDRLLAEERRREEVDKQREAARRQLAAELFVAEVRPTRQDSDTADAIAARVQAFKELKNIVDEKTLREIEAGGTNPIQNVFAWVRRTLID